MSVLELSKLSDSQLAEIRADKPKIKVAFFDVDGTLLAIDGDYPKQLPSLLDAVRGHGVKTGIASGRPSFATEFLFEELKLTAPGVFCTGAQIYFAEEKRFLASHYLPQALCRDMLAQLREHNIYHEVYTDTGFYIDHDIAPDIREVHASHLRISPKKADLAEIVERQGVLKFLIGANQAENNVVLDTLEKRFPTTQFAYAGLPKYPTWLFASVIDEQASKQKAFEQLLEYHNVSADEVIAFGDAQSDMTFLSLAGIGVAMGNASEEVKAVADFYTLPVWEDGLPYALKRLVLDEYLA